VTWDPARVLGLIRTLLDPPVKGMAKHLYSPLSKVLAIYSLRKNSFEAPMNCLQRQSDQMSTSAQKTHQGLEIEATALTLFVYSVQIDPKEPYHGRYAIRII